VVICEAKKVWFAFKSEIIETYDYYLSFKQITDHFLIFSSVIVTVLRLATEYIEGLSELVLLRSAIREILGSFPVSLTFFVDVTLTNFECLAITYDINVISRRKTTILKIANVDVVVSELNAWTIDSIHRV